MHVRLGVVLLALTFAVSPAAAKCAMKPAAAGKPAGAHGAFTFTSSDVHPDQPIAMAQVYNGMDCTGGNVSPALAWSGAPSGTKSFALTVFDPDAPTGHGWWHWVVYDIPADQMSLASGAGSANGQLPAGAVQGTTDFGKPGYGGPCPPPGKPHRYVFTLYALGVAKLDVPAGAKAAQISTKLNAHPLAKTTLTAKFGR
jgi:hypothetical protein